MKRKSKRDKLFALADEVVDAILQMSDEEVLEELEKEGISAETAGRSFDSLTDSARMKAARNELASARKKMQEERQERHSVAQSIMSPEEARALIERAGREIPNLTAAARNAKSGDVPDCEAVVLANSLLYLLGHKPKKA